MSRRLLAAPPWHVALWHGLRRRCPRCGRGPLFRRWIDVHDACAVCGLALGWRPGDVWGFWVVGDRIFVLVPLVLLYFGFTPLAIWARLLFLAAVAVPLVATMPHRLGVCLALDYLFRRREQDGAGEATG